MTQTMAHLTTQVEMAHTHHWRLQLGVEKNKEGGWKDANLANLQVE